MTTATPPSGGRPPVDRRLPSRGRVVSLLGIVEIFAWGSSYYLMAVLSAPIRAETGWSVATVSAGVSLGLFVSGLAAMSVGRVIQAAGGRRVLASGMALLAAGLVLLGLAQTLPVYFLAWGVMGLGMAAGLYDAAFSTLGRLFGSDARRAITALTLWGGFASTVSWPLSAWMVEAIGWRGACFAYAAFHLTVTLPICLLALPAAPRPVRRAGDATAPRAYTPGLRDLRFLCLVAAGVSIAMLAAIWALHLITILTAEGYALATAIGLGTLIGPAQVGARVIEMLGGGRHHPIWTMLAATGFILTGFAGLFAGLPAAGALIAFGAGNGLWSIARGALPLALFGAEGYPRTMGRLATPTLIAAAAAPLIGAALIEMVGPRGTLGVLAGMACVPFAATLVLYLTRVRGELRSAGAGDNPSEGATGRRHGPGR